MADLIPGPINLQQIPECVVHWDDKTPVKDWLHSLNRGADDEFSNEDFQHASKTLAGHDLTRWGDRFGDFKIFLAKYIQSQRCTERCWDPEETPYELEPICGTFPEPPLPPLPPTHPPQRPIVRRAKEGDQKEASVSFEKGFPETDSPQFSPHFPTPLGNPEAFLSLSELRRKTYPGEPIDVQKYARDLRDWKPFDPSKRFYLESGWHKKFGRGIDALLDTWFFQHIVGPHTYLLIFLSDPAGYYPNYNASLKEQREADQCWNKGPNGEKIRTGNCGGMPTPEAWIRESFHEKTGRRD